MIKISELAKYQPASLQSGCVTVSVNLDPEDDKPCSMGGKYGKYGRWGRKCCIPTPFAMGVYFNKVKQSKKCYLTFYKSEQRITSTSTASTEKEVVRKSFFLMGTGGLRGCMISHSTDANPTIRHQPLHCHNAPLSCTSYLKLNPALDINLCFAVFHILCVDVKTLHSIFCTTIP